ncbi:MAG: asparagine synthase (glutamine-hydrolyzing) [Candidatus Omnitrophota bacterium]|nr:MAG: asparagine synthase (glutamine-hydrolyzing) [Candidatus Omnitrophota bacterium]
MCGICGLLDYNSQNTDSRRIIKGMCSKLIHRGPDDEGIFSQTGSPNITLGHRRLSIIDLSSAGHQPMVNEDNSISLILNGEIYNYLELRTELESRGHVFRSNTDTEVVIHLYEEKGRDCVKSLRGMFAFALWDSNNKILFLARDRLGKKPLFYSHKDSRFLFSSELESLLESGFISKEINKDSLDYYLSFGYIPSPYTIYKNVFQLKPAHTLSLHNNELRVDRYWDLDYLPKLKISQQEAVEKVLNLLEEAVKIRLHSDVPLGAFLSGGIDSSTIVAIMSKVSRQQVKTFSIGFEDSDYSELTFAREISRIYGTEHHEFMVKPDALGVLPLLISRYGQPYADSSALPTYYVSKETRSHVTVALNGDGGDESFAGYERYHAMLIAESMYNLPPLLKRAIKFSSGFIPDSIEPKNRLRNIKRFFDAAFIEKEKRYIRWISIFYGELKNALYSAEFKSALKEDKAGSYISSFFNEASDGLLDSLLNADVHTYLPEDLLVKVDIASMANSLEARSPFLDHKFMEFAARLPSSYKIKNGIRKYILKKAIKGIVPDRNVYRRKMGFGVPIGRWFRNELKEYIRDTLLEPKTLRRGYFNAGIVKKLVEDHIGLRKDYSFQLWSLLVLELWHRKFID